MYSTGFQKTGSLLLYANYLDQVHKVMCPHKIPLLNEVGSSLSIPYWSTNTNFNQPSPLAMAEAKDISVIFIYFQGKVFLSFSAQVNIQLCLLYITDDVKKRMFHG